MRIAITKAEQKIHDEFSGILNADQIDSLYAILDAAIDGAHEDGYHEGLDYGEGNVQDKIEGGISEATDGLLENLKIGLDLIDTDRTASKVYLDRATRTLDRHLIEVSPCLL